MTKPIIKPDLIDRCLRRWGGGTLISANGTVAVKKCPDCGGTGRQT